MTWAIRENLLQLMRTHRAGAAWHCGPAAYRTICMMRDWGGAYLAQLGGPGQAPTVFGLPIAVAPSLGTSAVELRGAGGHVMGYISEIGVSAPYTPPAPPLTYDPAIYWVEPCYYCEYRIDWRILNEAQFDVREHARQNLRRSAAVEARKADWIAYTTIEDKRSEGDMLIFRHSLYEQPGFTQIHRYVGPPHIRQFRIQPQGGEIVTLDLRRLTYHGERARGALHGTGLYIILPAIAPERVGGLRE